MISMPDEKLTRIGVFYDGGYFSAVSDYYRYAHPRKQRLELKGLHEFIRHKVAELEGVHPSHCRVVDAHYFRGRFSATEADRAGKLLAERAFDDVLMHAGIITHYLPRTDQGEKGIDVWLALEAFELAVYKRFNVLVLLASDGDFLPLVRKINTLGTRVMLLAWEFDCTDDKGHRHSTRVAKALLEEVTYPVRMEQIIGEGRHSDDALVEAMFLQGEEPISVDEGSSTARMPVEVGRQHKGIIDQLDAAGFGFIADEQARECRWFFIARNVRSGLFQELKVGDSVRFKLEPNPRRPGAFWAVEIEKVEKE
ncbi:NYN domain-containing protein [Limisphaera sp. VF-2]|jgi:cold shock CspA family protein|uniref:NYN domain-containing protein n=1 Tax=Limisphaera sp. VF-2 TaxID=3400418 RepID=UPI003C1772BB